MGRISNVEMRKRIDLIFRQYSKMRMKYSFDAKQVNVKFLTWQFGFKNFTRIALLSEVLEKAYQKRCTDIKYFSKQELSIVYCESIIFPALGV